MCLRLLANSILLSDPLSMCLASVAVVRALHRRLSNPSLGRVRCLGRSNSATWASSSLGRSSSRAAANPSILADSFARRVVASPLMLSDSRVYRVAANPIMLWDSFAQFDFNQSIGNQGGGRFQRTRIRIRLGMKMWAFVACGCERMVDEER